MKRIVKLLLIGLTLTLFSFNSCESTSDSYESDTVSCGTYNGHTLYKGPKGGCYYINSNGNKTYVDRSYCDC